MFFRCAGGSGIRYLLDNYHYASLVVVPLLLQRMRFGRKTTQPHAPQHPAWLIAHMQLVAESSCTFRFSLSSASSTPLPPPSPLPSPQSSLLSSSSSGAAFCCKSPTTQQQHCHSAKLNTADARSFVWHCYSCIVVVSNASNICFALLLLTFSFCLFMCVCVYVCVCCFCILLFSVVLYCYCCSCCC